MAFPAALRTVTIRGKITNVVGTPARGQVQFTMPAALRDPADQVILTPTVFRTELDAEGAFEIELPATDSPGVFPTGWSYLVVVITSLWRPVPFHVLLPHAVETVEFDALMPALSPALLQQYAPLVHSHGEDGGSVGDATSSAKGLVRLAGDLGGTAAAPTVPRLDTLQAEIDGAAGTLEALAVTVAGKAGQGAVDALAADVATKAAQADLTALAADVATRATEDDLDGLAFDVAMKAAQTDLDVVAADVAAAQAALATKANLVGGVLPTSQLPAIAVTDFLEPVGSQAAMLALVGQRGDWTVRTDLGTTWVITGDNPTLLASWTALSYPAAPVTSVNDQGGAVVLGKGDVGLGAVDNTSDSTKPISAATATALAGKAAASRRAPRRGDHQRHAERGTPARPVRHVRHRVRVRRAGRAAGQAVPRQPGRRVPEAGAAAIRRRRGQPRLRAGVRRRGRRVDGLAQRVGAFRGTPPNSVTAKDDALFRAVPRGDLVAENGAAYELQNSARTMVVWGRKWRNGALVRNGITMSDTLVLGAVDPVPPNTPINTVIVRTS